MQPHQQRVIDEKNDLDAKRDKLIAFLNGNIFPTLSSEEQDLLGEQAKFMRQYSEILGKRIAAF